ncbi:Uu.00g023570.m01.CDS01 [Anthostomella pinea]|uniref:Uu.00g023570.m01.CDS01 n=1 Tax=Anthostomella pinea TaxID=933095 RepID=A0AAI8YR06_9PEZI|nr:Uu.00g023570.m01.CDS01 [Anthostomella pinea]
MASAVDPFTFIERSVEAADDDGQQPRLFDEFSALTSAKIAGPFMQLLVKLRSEFPEYVVTYTNPANLNLMAFAAVGNATATINTDTDSVFRMRYWLQPAQRGSIGHLGDALTFAKYRYSWGREAFIIARRRRGPALALGATDALLAEVGKWQYQERKGIYVYDRYWYLDRALYDQVQKASWYRVILDPDMKRELRRVRGRFFDSRDVYEDLGVPWKRGIIFYGPVGNGKTVSIKALMHTLGRRDPPVPTLYVKAAPATGHIRAVFAMARQMSPCLLVLEDIDTIVTKATRSYFFNEVDGLENNDGIFMVASTNHIDQLDPGLSKRPSRFDRKYLFPEPSKDERVQYVHYWRQKLIAKGDMEFPEELVVPIADITHGFSFAYIQEAFVTTLLEMAHRRDGGDDEDEDSAAHSTSGSLDDDDDLDKYELWRVMKQTVKTLRDEMESKLQEPMTGSALNGAEVILSDLVQNAKVTEMDAGLSADSMHLPLHLPHHMPNPIPGAVDSRAPSMPVRGQGAVGWGLQQPFLNLGPNNLAYGL